MAYDYDTANTGNFVRYGLIVKAVNTANYAASFDTLRNATVAPWEAIDLAQEFTDAYDAFDQLHADAVAARSSLSGLADLIWSERTLSLSQLQLLEYSPATFWPRLFQQMVADTESIQKNTVTLNAVAAGSANVGDGTVILTKRLDGVNPPLNGGPVVPHYGIAAVDSQLAFNETFKFICVADQFTGGSAGAESFTWQGEIAAPPFDTFGGSGGGPTLTVGGSTLIINGTFEDFAVANTPDSWTKTAGTIGTHIKQTVVAGEFYRGLSAVVFIGDGAEATIEIEQAIDPGSVVPLQLFCISARVKASATPAAGALEIAMRGTGWTVAASEKIQVAAGALTTSWVLHSAFSLIPLVIPTDLEAYAKITGTLSAGKSVYIDDIIIQPVTYHGGVGAVYVPGSTPFAVGDFHTALIANDNKGVFAEHLRKHYLVQLPGADAETIADTLAT